MNSFFENLCLPQLTKEECKPLDDKITLNELFESLKQMKKGKSPGLDGIPPELYLEFWTDLGPIMLDMIDASLQKGFFNRDVNTAIISLLCKANKDPTNCASYRPVSLLNSDVKLFAKTLANRLHLVIPKLIHPDQSGFVKAAFTPDLLFLERATSLHVK